MPTLNYSNDPKDRPKTLCVHQSEPFNAEPEDLEEFISHHITPIHLAYGRNHGPIPNIKEEEYRLEVNGLVEKPLTLTLSDLKSMPRTDVVAALQVRPFQMILLTTSVLEIVEHQCPKFVKRKEFHGPKGLSQIVSTQEFKSRTC